MPALSSASSALLRAVAAAPLLGATLPLPRVVPSLVRDPGRGARDGHLYGAAVRADQLADDAAVRHSAAVDCDWITPEIDWKWNALEYHRGGWW